jgi:Fe-S-cluster containining protein
MGFDADFEKWKQECFGNYCITKCEKTCCDMRNVSLSVNKVELMRIYDGKISPENFTEMGIKTAGSKGMYSIESKDFCRKFDSHTRMCLMYDRRSLSCRAYPFLVEKDSVLIKSGCSLTKGDPEYKKLIEIASFYGKVIVKRAGK